MSDILLDVKNLNIVYSTSDGVVYALNDANLQIKRGETTLVKAFLQLAQREKSE